MNCSNCGHAEENHQANLRRPCAECRAGNCEDYQSPALSDVFWIIEGNGTYWSGRGIHNFERTWEDAVHFKRCQDAERVLYWLLPKEYQQTCRAVEHMMIPQERAKEG